MSEYQNFEFEAENANNGKLVRRIFIGLMAVVILTGVGFFLVDIWKNANQNTAQITSNAKPYLTIDKAGIRSKPDEKANIIAYLQAKSLVAGEILPSRDGNIWLKITAVDGASGYLKKEELQEIKEKADLRKIESGFFAIITSSNLNIRNFPSIASPVIGYIDGGSRLTADGRIKAEGEIWLRLGIGSGQTGYIMARFTQIDEDANKAADFASDGPGVRGIANLVVNVQATPFDTARVIKPLQIGDYVRILGQTEIPLKMDSNLAEKNLQTKAVSKQIWYIVRLDDGNQGFVPKDSIRIDTSAKRWIYSDGTLAEGPDIPDPRAQTALNAVTNSEDAGNSTSPPGQ